MPTTSSDDAKKRDPRRSSQTGGARSDGEPHVPDHDPADLEDDQADSGPDRDRTAPGN